MLGGHEITALIRDTEPHERALFSTDAGAPMQDKRRSRRTTTFVSEDTRSFPFRNGQRKQSLVPQVLGREALQELEASKGGSKRTGGVNIEVLLRGAEKLCAVYPVAGAAEKVASLRSQNQQLAESVALLEAKVTQQTTQLDNFSQGDSEFGHGSSKQPETSLTDAGPITEEDLQAEEDEIAALEQKKQRLENRLSGIDRDLVGLRR